MPGARSSRLPGRLGVDRASQLCLYLTLAVSHLALLLTGEVHPVHMAIIIVTLIAAAAVPDRLSGRPAWMWNVLLILVLLLCLGAALYPYRSFESYYHGVSYFLIYVILIRYFTRKTPADEFVLCLLGLLEISAATVITTSMFFLVLLFIFIVLSLSTVILLNLKSDLAAVRDRWFEVEKAEARLEPGPRGRDVVTRSAPPLISGPAFSIPLTFFRLPLVSTVVIFALGFIFFFTIPRLGFSLFAIRAGGANLVSGFSDQVELGSVGKIMLSDTLVMRVRLDGRPAGEDLYFRGNALDHYDGRAWKDTLGSKNVMYTSVWVTVRLTGVSSLKGGIKQEIILEPTDSNVLFALTQVIGVTTPLKNKAILEYWNDYIGFPPTDAIYDRMVYTVWSRPAPVGAAACREAYQSAPARPLRRAPAYLQMPPGSEAVGELALKVAGREGASCDRIAKLESYLAKNYAYDLHPPEAPGRDPIQNFLFVSRRGYCEHFATALCLLLRSLGIPARIAAGYLASDYNPLDDYYRVRENNAHTWVEVYLPDGRWLQVDPTPPVIREQPPPWLRWWRNLADSVRYRWERYVIDLSLGEQFNLALRLHHRGNEVGRRLSALPGTLSGLFRTATNHLVLTLPLLIMTAAGFYYFWRGRAWRKSGRERGRPPAITDLIKDYLKLLAQLSKRGYDRGEAETPRELASRISAQRPPYAGPVHTATELYLAARFGEKPLGPDAKKAIAQARAALKKS